MANTYTLIASNVLSSSATSVTFSSIPSTYTDLVLKYSARSDRAGLTVASVDVKFNAVGGTSYSSTRLQGDGSSAGSSRVSDQSQLTLHFAAGGATSTSNTFANNELYIPNYSVTQQKPISSYIASENNTATAYLVTHAGLFTNTAAITSIGLTIASGDNFVSGSSFFLYGIKNS